MPGMKVPCGECIIQKCVAWYWKLDLSLSPSFYLSSHPIIVSSSNWLVCYGKWV